jgi:hypothetical protein
MQTAKIWLVGIASVLSCTATWAANSDGTHAVHHCLSAQGRAVYQDQPCEQTGLRPAKRKAQEPQQQATPPAVGPVRPAQAQPRPAAPRLIRTPRTV